MCLRIVSHAFVNGYFPIERQIVRQWAIDIGVFPRHGGEFLFEEGRRDVIRRHFVRFQERHFGPDNAKRVRDIDRVGNDID